MKLKNPVMLLLSWLVLPMGVGYSRFLVAQILLSQIKAIYVARQAEQQLSQNLDCDPNRVDIDDAASPTDFGLNDAALDPITSHQNAQENGLDQGVLDHPLKEVAFSEATLRELLTALQFDPGNTTARAYVGLFSPLL